MESGSVDHAPGLGDQLWSSEQLVLCRDDAVGLRAVIAIDDTTLGPGLGGVRLRPYPTAADAIAECRRLAAAMTLKNAVAGVPFGGSKSVMLAPSEIRDREALMRRFGEFVRRLGGTYVPGVDMGTTTDDLALIAESGCDVSCADEDPSPWTALGVFAAIRAAVEHLDGASGLDGASVLVQGAGHVGASLARRLAEAGARVLVADIDRDRARSLAAELDGSAVEPGEALETPCDVLAPCAVARVLSSETIPRLRCRAVCGAANDMLAEAGCAEALAERGILYVPEFVANGGGVIQIHALREGWDEERLVQRLLGIGDVAGELLEDAGREGITPLAAAEARASRRLAAARDGLPGRPSVRA